MKKSFFLATSLMLAFSANAQKTHTINNTPGTSANFTSITDAIAAAAPGDTLYVQQSKTSYGNVDLNKKLVIIGRSGNHINYTTTLNKLNILEGANGSVIKGFNMDMANYTNVTNITLAENVFRRGIDSFNSPKADNMVFTGNVLRGGIDISRNMTNSTISNNILLSRIHAFGGTNITFENNIMKIPSVDFKNYKVFNVTNCIFLANDKEETFIEGLNNKENGLNIKNCITYNYGKGKIAFKGNNITLTNVKENTNPLFVKVDTTALYSLAGREYYPTRWDPYIDDLHLQEASPFGTKGIYENYNFSPLSEPNSIPTVKFLVHEPYSVDDNNTLSVTILAKANASFKDSKTTIVTAEYFYNTDPGIGKAAKVALQPTAIPNQFIVNIPLQTTNTECVLAGLYIRVKDSKGTWSLYDMALDANAKDEKAPVVKVMQRLTVELKDKSVTITPEQLDKGTTDDCGFFTLSLDKDTFTEEGEYKVKLIATDTGGKTDYRTSTVTVVGTLGVKTEQLQKHNLELYPNPVTHSLNIKTALTIKKITINTINGKLITAVNPKTSHINMTHLPTGIYLLKIECDNTTLIKRIVKQ